MQEEKLLESLLELARNLGYEVRLEKGSFRDGACRLHERNLILLNRASTPARKVAALSLALSGHTLNGVFLLPAIRDAIEKATLQKLVTQKGTTSSFGGRHHG